LRCTITASLAQPETEMQRYSSTENLLSKSIYR
jgi:hypothetical protein